MNGGYKDGSVFEQMQITEEVDLQNEVKPRRGWNFGAFTFPLIWALCNGCMWQAIIMLDYEILFRRVW